MEPTFMYGVTVQGLNLFSHNKHCQQHETVSKKTPQWFKTAKLSTKKQANYKKYETVVQKKI